MIIVINDLYSITMSVYRCLRLQDIDFLRQVQPPLSESCIIIGENNLLKSSLLFQTALSIACDGDQVIFICPSPLEQHPYRVSGMTQPSCLVLECIKMVYIQNPANLLKYLCDFHRTESLPAAIIIDDLQYYVSHFDQDQSKEAAMVKLLAILEDTVAFITQKKGEACHRMVSLLSGACPKNLIKRYFRELWHISSGENEGEFFLTDDHVPAFRVHFHLSNDQEIVTDKIYRLSVETEVDVLQEV